MPKQSLNTGPRIDNLKAMVTVPLVVICAFALAFAIVLATGTQPAGAQVSITAEGTGDVGNAGVIGPVIVIGLTLATIKKLVDFVAYVRNQDWDTVAKTTLAVIAGIGFAFLLQATDFAKDIQLAGVVLSDTNPATVIFFGLSLAASAGIFVDVIAAIDNTRSSKVPPLLKGEQG